MEELTFSVFSRTFVPKHMKLEVKIFFDEVSDEASNLERFVILNGTGEGTEINLGEKK